MPVLQDECQHHSSETFSGSSSQSPPSPPLPPPALLVSSAAAEECARTTSNHSTRLQDLSEVSMNPENVQAEEEEEGGQPECAPETGPYQAAGSLGKQRRAVSSLKFSGSGELLAAASADTAISIWDPKKRLLVRELKGGHTQGVSDVAWARDSQYLASASDDKTVRIWDTETGQELGRFTGHTGYVFCVTFNAQGSLLASGSADESVHLWDLRAGSCLRTLAAHAEPVTGVDFNEEGTCLVSGSYDGLVRLWNVGMGHCLKTLFAEGAPAVSHVRYAPNGRGVLVSTLDSTVRLWKVASPSAVTKTYQGHQNLRLCTFACYCAPEGAAASGQGRKNGPQYVSSGSEDGKVYVWDMQSQALLQTLGGHQDAVLSLAAHPTDGVLASGGTTADRSIRLWRPRCNGAD